MPKILENVREMLIAETRKQVEENGYAATSIRSVARACNIAAGTVYNYFPSKDALIAVFMAEDWALLSDSMKTDCEKQSNPLEVLKILHEGLLKYIREHEKLFLDPQASIGFAAAGEMRHTMLIDQLTAIAGPVLSTHSKVKDADVTLFAVETLLNWTMQKRDISAYYKIISQLFIEEEVK